MRTYLIGIVASSLVGCTSPAPQPGEPTPGGTTDLPPPADVVPSVTGVYLGHYSVPTPDHLAAAAVFPMDSVEWTVVGDIVTLHYNLPRGLVGGTLPVTLQGVIGPGARQVTLTGAAGDGVCVAQGTKVTCREVFGDLGVLPMDVGVVEQVAARQFAGPVASRVAVANLFGADPIGIVDFDLTAPGHIDPGGDGSDDSIAR